MSEKDVNAHLELLRRASNRVERELEKHPGDAPWSCVECYHSRPCVDREILLAARAKLKELLP